MCVPVILYVYPSYYYYTRTIRVLLEIMNSCLGCADYFADIWVD
eukprot:COSAG02_NODE_17814_length_979_cov_0.876136_2_plen_43_part_01